MSSKTPPSVVWAEGSVFLQDGYLYVSPNCRRPVKITPRPNGNPPNPFKIDIRLTPEDFKQPVWWSDVYGWMSFVPLAPSFLEMPFVPLCWYPHTEVIKNYSKVGGVLHQMKMDDGIVWNRVEQRIIEAVMKLRVAYKIPGTLPPVPSVFDFTAPYASKERCLVSIERAREWFAIWMGFFSYVIAQIRLYPHLSTQERESDVPVWYTKLLESDRNLWPETWLNGVNASTVCNFGAGVHRAGIVMQWTRLDKTRPDIEWFLEHNIPVFYPWSASEEEAVSVHYDRRFLEPPHHMIQDALTLLFSTPSVPLAALVVRNFYGDRPDSDAPALKDTLSLLQINRAASIVLEFTYKRLRLEYEEMLDVLDQDPAVLDEQVRTILEEQQRQCDDRAREAVQLPVLCMLEEDDRRARGTLIDPDNFHAWVDKRDRLTEELIKGENFKEKQACLNRERNPGFRKADVYEWHARKGRHGKLVYSRDRVNNNEKEGAFMRFAKTQTRFNSCLNEWDLCELFDVNAPDSDNSDEDLPIEYEDDCSVPPLISSPLGESVQPPVPSIQPSPRVSPPRRAVRTRSPSPFPPATEPMGEPMAVDRPLSPIVRTESQIDELWLKEMVQIEPREKWDQWMNQVHDVVESFSIGYGYVAPVGLPVCKEELDDRSWKNMLMNCGFDAIDGDVDGTPPREMRMSLYTFYLCMSGKKKTEEVIPSDLYDLDPRNRVALQYVLNDRRIYRPTGDMFVFSEPRSTTAEWLLGVESPDVALYVARCMVANPDHTILTIASRLVSRLIKCRTLLAQPMSNRQRTVAMRYIPDVVREADYVFTSADFRTWFKTCADLLLDEYHGRAALLMGGVVGRIAQELFQVHAVLDGPSKEVTRYGTGFILQTDINTVYCDDELTEAEIAKVCGAYSLYDAQRKRESVKYWFPPPSVWDSHRSGFRFIEWTQRNEVWFGGLWNRYLEGKAQPKTVEQWRAAVRGSKFSRYWYNTNKERAAKFMDAFCPVSQALLDRVQ